MGQGGRNALQAINRAFLLEGLAHLPLDLRFKLLSAIENVAVEPSAGGDRRELRQILIGGQTEQAGLEVIGDDPAARSRSQ